jgi:hypothetical protein
LEAPLPETVPLGTASMGSGFGSSTTMLGQLEPISETNFHGGSELFDPSDDSSSKYLSWSHISIPNNKDTKFVAIFFASSPNYQVMKSFFFVSGLI